MQPTRQLGKMMVLMCVPHAIHSTQQHFVVNVPEISPACHICGASCIGGFGVVLCDLQACVWSGNGVPRVLWGFSRGRSAWDLRGNQVPQTDGKIMTLRLEHPMGSMEDRLTDTDRPTDRQTDKGHPFFPSLRCAVVLAHSCTSAVSFFALHFRSDPGKKAWSIFPLLRTSGRSEIVRGQTLLQYQVCLCACQLHM